jgi:hypothetical protein
MDCSISLANASAASSEGMISATVAAAEELDGVVVLAPPLAPAPAGGEQACVTRIKPLPKINRLTSKQLRVWDAIRHLLGDRCEQT